MSSIAMLPRGRALATIGAGLATMLPSLGWAATNADPIRIGFVPNADTYIEPKYALDGGFFKRAGLNVDVTPLQNAGAIATALAGGSLDVGLGSLNGIATAQSHGLPFAFFAPGAVVTTKAPTSLLMVAKDSPITTAVQLEGKTIAVDLLSGLGQMGMLAWMTKNGGDITRVNFIEMPFSSMATALIGKKLDAAYLSEPTLSANRADLRVLGNPYGAIADEWYISLWYASLPWLQANNDTAHAIARVARETALWANAHPEATAPILSATTRIPLDVVARMTRARYADKLSPALMQPVLDWAFKAHLLKTPVLSKNLIAPAFQDA
jgi:NitT/TauT family transport system substrate-binding protein